jgi:NDP-sugar pyrophosphorylase family protein
LETINLCKEILDCDEALLTRRQSDLNRLWDRAIAAGRLYGLRLEGRWMHVGSPLGLAEAERALAKRYDD